MNLRHAAWLGWGLLLVGLALGALGTCVGSAGFENLLRPLLDAGAEQSERDMALQIVTEIRLPRTLGAWAAGGLLGLAGALAQGLFRNPLADPYLLGSASGASLGVAVALAADHAGAVLAVLLTLALARGVGHTLRLLLSGVIVGVVLGALTSLVLLFSPESLQAMQAFMLGTTGFIGWTAWGLMFSVWCLCALVAWSLARVLDGLSLGEATAQSLGLPLGPLRAALVGMLALATGTAVAQTGLIAFVGLAAPHLVRAAVKVPHRQLMWLASLMGGVLLEAADLLARWAIAPQELPVGVVTAALGGGYLLWLMHRRSSGIGSGGLL